jgi:predicted nucleic acid-binding protein
MRYVLADTGIWFAMFDRRDPYANAVEEKAEILDRCQVVLPWPTLYETLRTRMVRNTIALQQFEKYLRRPQVQYLDDSRYREAALELAFQSSLRRSRPLSMVDCLMTLVLNDRSVKLHYLATFNDRDFVDVCRRRGIGLV